MPRRTGRGTAVGRLGALVAGVAAMGLCVGAAGAGEWAPGPRQRAIPLERTALGGWIVTATLDGRLRGRFLLDTGATWCAITPRTAARLRLAQVGEQVTMQTAAGLVPMPLVRIGSVDVGGHKARDVQAVILPDELPDLDGLIGMNFLHGFSYAVDSRRGLLRIE